MAEQTTKVVLSKALFEELKSQGFSMTSPDVTIVSQNARTVSLEMDDAKHARLWELTDDIANGDNGKLKNVSSASASRSAEAWQTKNKTDRPSGVVNQQRANGEAAIARSKAARESAKAPAPKPEKAPKATTPKVMSDEDIYGPDPSAPAPKPAPVPKPEKAPKATTPKATTPKATTPAPKDQSTDVGRVRVRAEQLKQQVKAGVFTKTEGAAIKAMLDAGELQPDGFDKLVESRVAAAAAATPAPAPAPAPASAAPKPAPAPKPGKAPRAQTPNPGASDAIDKEIEFQRRSGKRGNGPSSPIPKSGVGDSIGPYMDDINRLEAEQSVVGTPDGKGKVVEKGKSRSAATIAAEEEIAASRKARLAAQKVARQAEAAGMSVEEWQARNALVKGGLTGVPRAVNPADTEALRQAKLVLGPTDKELMARATEATRVKDLARSMDMNHVDFAKMADSMGMTPDEYHAWAATQGVKNGTIVDEYQAYVDEQRAARQAAAQRTGGAKPLSSQLAPPMPGDTRYPTAFGAPHSQPAPAMSSLGSQLAPPMPGQMATPGPTPVVASPQIQSTARAAAATASGAGGMFGAPTGQTPAPGMPVPGAGGGAVGGGAAGGGGFGPPTGQTPAPGMPVPGAGPYDGFLFKSPGGFKGALKTAGSRIGPGLGWLAAGQTLGGLSKSFYDDPESQADDALSSALTWGGAGAGLGSMLFPGIGTAVGGGLGLVGGAIKGWFDGDGGSKEDIANESASQRAKLDAAFDRLGVPSTARQDLYDQIEIQVSLGAKSADEVRAIYAQAATSAPDIIQQSRRQAKLAALQSAILPLMQQNRDMAMQSNQSAQGWLNQAASTSSDPTVASLLRAQGETLMGNAANYANASYGQAVAMPTLMDLYGNSGPYPTNAGTGIIDYQGLMAQLQPSG